MLPSQVLHEASSDPGIWIVALVPVDERLAASNTWVSRPRTTEHNVVLAVEKVG